MRQLSRIILLLTLFGCACATALTTHLSIRHYPIKVDGKTSDLLRVEQPDHTWGYIGTEGDTFDAIVTNETNAPTVLHWHGLLIPNNQDGVPYVTQPPIMPGKSYHYHFKLKQHGTYWMHSHADLQIQRHLAAPFIIHKKNKQHTEKEVILFLADFSYQSPETILYSLQHAPKQSSMKMNKPDLTDVKYAHFLTNYRTLQNPDIIKVRPDETVLLRIIDGSAMTNFFVNTGSLVAEVVATDGHEIAPSVQASRFQLAVGQRLDVRVKIPKAGGTFPILAQAEGTSLRTGLILTTSSLPITSVSESATPPAGAINYQQELQFHAKFPLVSQKPAQTLIVNLEGDMMRYIWKLNNEVWPQVKPLIAKPNRRIEIIFNNKTGMSHPMHLHGHVFQITEIDGKPIANGPLRDTAFILPHSVVKIQFDANNPGNWVLHCHMLYHQATGMMTLMGYENVPIPDLAKATMA